MSIAIILDCGATNVRAMAVNSKGKIVASHHIRNETLQSNTQPVQHVWDFKKIWQKLTSCCQQVTSQINSQDICAISVTTFGVDGAPFNKEEEQIYPVISWKCGRTNEIMAQVDMEIDRTKLYQENGIADYSFNTAYKLKWLKEYEPEIYNQMDKFVFISSMLTHRLTGNLTTDRTMAGTSMLTCLKTGEWHKDILKYLGITPEHFPPIINAGETVGYTLKDISSSLGIPAGTPVISAGHDTQFALFGSGVKENQLFLSSGTWEILMGRTNCPNLDTHCMEVGLTSEFDSKPELYNPAMMWLSSAVLEWVIDTLFKDVENETSKYAVIESEGERAPIGCNNVKFNPAFLLDKNNNGHGFISGLSINATRGEIYRAALESLAFQLRKSIVNLSKVTGMQADSLVVVGGGSKNDLWNQIRADILNIPILVVSEAECTVIGAAMYAFYGSGVFISTNDAQEAMKPSYSKVLPSKNSKTYKKIIDDFKKT